MDLQDKFAGCIVGGLVGDCFGVPFEWKKSNLEKVKQLFSNLGDNEDTELPYTDDTAMAWNILDSLIARKGYDAKDMALRFAETWRTETSRAYGGHVRFVFYSWLRRDYKDIYEPAAKQFGGSGSYGNGGAMRIAPIALYWYTDQEKMIKLALLITKLTHTNPDGYVGALLQCGAVRLALDKDPKTNSLNSDEFIDQLIDLVNDLEDPSAQAAKKLYTSKLEQLKKFIRNKENTDIEKIVDVFGNDITAPKSVLPALYCFLRAAEGPIDFIEADNPFERTIQLAVSLGGDSDTIGCMAGGIAGSYYGLSGIPEYLPRHCENVGRGKEFAKKLYERNMQVPEPSEFEVESVQSFEWTSYCAII